LVYKIQAISSRISHKFDGAIEFWNFIHDQFYKSEISSVPIVYCIWSGENEMSESRKSALLTIVKNIDCSVCLITSSNLCNFEVKNHPFHDAYVFLSETHKSDYLRAYLMHHYGGGYTDIKLTYKSWRPYFRYLRGRECDMIGYPEIGPHGVAPVGGALEEQLRTNWRMLVGMCAFICRPKTKFTTTWMDRVHSVLDEKLSELKANPASWPQDAYGRMKPDGTSSLYPLSWTEILGDILHPLCFEYNEYIKQADMAPLFDNYR
jgi:hypothetical protein